MWNIVSNFLKKEEVKQELCLKGLILSNKDEDFIVHNVKHGKFQNRKPVFYEEEIFIKKWFINKKRFNRPVA